MEQHGGVYTDTHIGLAKNLEGTCTRTTLPAFCWQPVSVGVELGEGAVVGVDIGMGVVVAVAVVLAKGAWVASAEGVATAQPVNPPAIISIVMK